MPLCSKWRESNCSNLKKKKKSSICCENILQMVSLLLSKGANVNANDKKERKAIHWAAYHGNWCSNFYIYVQNEYKY